jgi:hypothetical protein
VTTGYLHSEDAAPGPVSPSLRSMHPNMMIFTPEAPQCSQWAVHMQYKHILHVDNAELTYIRFGAELFVGRREKRNTLAKRTTGRHWAVSEITSPRGHVEYMSLDAVLRFQHELGMGVHRTRFV